jgi:hypothetical protein
VQSEATAFEQFFDAIVPQLIFPIVSTKIKIVGVMQAVHNVALLQLEQYVGQDKQLFPDKKYKSIQVKQIAELVHVLQGVIQIVHFGILGFIESR